MRWHAPKISRRRVLGGSLALAGLATAPRLSPALAASRTPTPAQPSGPFYPSKKPLDRDNDLVAVRGQTGRAEGRILHVVGRVLDPAGRPIRRARIEIWQANSFGRYQGTNDLRDVPLDSNFQGYGEDTSDADGAYQFRTIVPPAYQASANWTRPPHIHFSIAAEGFAPLVTQMYFAGNPLNERDPLLNAIADPAERARLIVELRPPTPHLGPKSALAVFDIVLAPAG